MSAAPQSGFPEPAAAVRQRFVAWVAEAVELDDFVRLVLAKPQDSGNDLLQLLVRRIVLHGRIELSLVYRHRTRDVTRNVAVAEGLGLIAARIGTDFAHAHLRTRSDEVSLLIGKRGRHTLTRRRADSELDSAPRGHDRERHRWLELDRPFLAALGVTDAQHRLVPAMARKWRQINKFIEVFDSAWGAGDLAARSAVRVLDFGSGKGYLTFAIHDHLTRVTHAPVQVTGVELREDMVGLCSAAVERLGIEGLRFERGDVRSYSPGAIDVMIALHACDTATDHAIELGVRAGAAIIMCAPCCHKEVRPQLLSPHPLRAILRHGVHLGQEAEMVTDGLRALLLEASGYATQVFEFVSLEHTSKNKMILAVKRAQPGAPHALLEQVQEVKRFYGIREQCLERLLKARWAAAPAPPGSAAATSC